MSRTTVAPFPRRVAGNPYCDLLYGQLTAIGVDVDADIMSAPGAPTMFSLRDPDGNSIWVVENPEAS